MADLEALTRRVQNWAERAVKKRATVDEYQRFVFDRRNHTFPAITRVFEDHLGFATLKLGLAELDSLLEEDLVIFKTVLFEETAKAIIREEGFTPESLWDGISPDNPNNKNIFEHEWEHAAPLPDEIRAEAIMYFTFLEHEGDVNLAGAHIAVGGSDIVHALSSSEPRWLTKEDAVGALRHARNTRNEPFIDIITERIRHRSRHSWPGPVKSDWSDVLGK